MGWFLKAKNKERREPGSLVPYQELARSGDRVRQEPDLAPGQLAITFTRTRMVVETSHQIVDVPGRVQALLKNDPVALQEWAEQHILPSISDWQGRNISSSLTFAAAEVR